MNTDPSRKHGAFDARYPAAAKLAAPSGELLAGVDYELDWPAFAARFFPLSRRHDYEAIASYVAWKNGSEKRPDRELPKLARPIGTRTVATPAAVTVR